MAFFHFQQFESYMTYSCYAMLIIGVVTFLTLLIQVAPYGKFSQSKGWGPLLPARVAWMLMESPNLWITLIFYLVSQSSTPPTHLESYPIDSFPNKVLISMYLLHYINRSLIFPLLLPSNSNPMPVSVMLMAFLYCSWNGFNQSLSLIFYTEYEHNYTTRFNFLFGIFLFFFGMYINIQSDFLLMKLKRSAAAKKKTDGDNQTSTNAKGYVIPTGGFFTYVSCANYCKLS